MTNFKPLPPGIPPAARNFVSKIAPHVNIYRIVVFLACVFSIAMALAAPVYFAEPDDWTYFFAVRNFSHGQLTINNLTHLQQVNEATRLGGRDAQFWNIGYNEWASEKAPGYVFYLVPFYLMKIPRLANILLELGMVFVTYLLLKRLRDEKTAMLGTVLLILNPMSLIMLNRAYMDTYAAQAFLVMGGGLYIYYHLERHRLGPKKRWILLFLAFFFTGWAVVTRYTNLVVAVMPALHFVIVRAGAWRRGGLAALKRELPPFLLGVGLPALVLLGYDWSVFGSPFNYGYRYTKGDITFAYQYLGQVNDKGQSRPLQIIWNNLKNAPRPLLVAFPLLVVGIPGYIYILVQKIRGCFPRVKAWGISFAGAELPWDILILLTGWFAGVFGLYLMYEFTSNISAGVFIYVTRFYMPGTFPIAVICALVMARFPFRLYIPALALLAAFDTIIYLQTTAHISILPGWVINGWPRYVPGFRLGFMPPDRPVVPP